MTMHVTYDDRRGHETPSAMHSSNQQLEWYVLQHLHCTFSSSCDDNISQCFRIEASFAVREVILYEEVSQTLGPKKFRRNSPPTSA
jgi:hypothetical protein